MAAHTMTLYVTVDTHGRMTDEEVADFVFETLIERTDRMFGWVPRFVGITLPSEEAEAM